MIAVATLHATAQTPDAAKIPVRIINGRLVVACQISSQKRIPANLFIDYEAPVGLLMHNKAADGIACENEDGTSRPITIHLPDINLVVNQREAGDEETFDKFTKWYSKELGENAVVGTIGARVLSNYHVVFDLPAGFLELSPAHAKSDQPPVTDPGSFTMPLSLWNDVPWVQVAFGTKRAAALGIGTAKYDSWIDRDLADELGHPAGDIGPVMLASIDLAQYVAFRPEEMKYVHPDGVFGMTGLGLLLNFRVEIDRTNRFTRWTPSGKPSFPKADLEYFQARLTEKPEPLEAWLEKHPTERLATEASSLLLDLQLARRADAAVIEKAMTWVQSTRPEDLKATGALELMSKMFQAGLPAYVLTAGKLGIEGGRKDRYPDAVHKIHARMGNVLLEQGDSREAQRHLISAAFGLPEDGPLNLDLARYYEREGRFNRAFSRYLVALLAAESGPQAIEGLMRVQPKVPDSDAYSVDAIERLIEGKIVGFGAATKYKAPEDKKPTRVVALELYANAHDEGEIGVALARDALRDHFGKDYLVQIVYHVPDPAFEPLVNPLSMHMWETFGSRGLVHKIDGEIDAPPRGLVKHKEEIFDVCKGAITKELGRASKYTFEVTAKADVTGVRGKVVVKGPAVEDAIVQVLLVERGVLFPGKSKVVIQRSVARASLTSAVGGVPFVLANDAMTIDFDRTFESIQTENRLFLEDEMRKGAAVVPTFATRIDPRQASVVVLLRERDTGGVMQAIQIDPELSEDLR
jgi:hypothetical protein